MARLGMAGEARHGAARLGEVGLGAERQGGAGLGRHGAARRGVVRFGMARCGRQGGSICALYGR